MLGIPLERLSDPPDETADAEAEDRVDEAVLPETLPEGNKLELTLLLGRDELSDETLENELLSDELDRDPGQHGQPGIFFIVMAYSGGQYSTSMTGRQFSFLH